MQRAPSCTAVTIEQTSRSIALSINLGFRVAGKVVARTVNVGDRVGAGDVVAKLDPQDQKPQAQSAQAELAGRDFEPLPGGSRSCALHDVERPRLCLARGLRPQEGGERRSAQGRLDRAVGWAKDAQRRAHPRARQKGWARFALATLRLS
jgi:multidrug efflux pump subunit AcrA (membrane-fusion protein)